MGGEPSPWQSRRGRRERPFGAGWAGRCHWVLQTPCLLPGVSRFQHVPQVPPQGDSLGKRTGPGPNSSRCRALSSWAPVCPSHAGFHCPHPVTEDTPCACHSGGCTGSPHPGELLGTCLWSPRYGAGFGHEDSRKWPGHFRLLSIRTAGQTHRTVVQGEGTSVAPAWWLRPSCLQGQQPKEEPYCQPWTLGPFFGV